MSAEIIIIIIFSIMGLAAHAARKHPWIEWTLRVIYGFSFVAEIQMVLLGDSQHADTLTPWSTGIAVVMAAMTGLMLFRPCRQVLSYGLTGLNQMINGAVLLEVFKNRQQKLAKTTPAILASTPDKPGATAQVPEGTQTQAPEETQAQAPGETQAQAPGETQAQAPGETQAQAPGETQAQAPEETQAQAPGETQAQAPGETQAQAPGEDKAQTHVPGPANSAPPITTVMQPPPLPISESTPTSGTVVTPGVSPLKATGLIATIFLSESVFVSTSMPHLNGLWIYVTVLGSLLASINLENFQLPSIALPFPVPLDSLFSYNFLGLVILAACGCGIFVARKPLAVLQRLGIVKPAGWQIGVGLLAVPATFLYDYLWSLYTGSSPAADIGGKLSMYNAGTFQAMGAGPALIMALATGICAGIGEETLIRGGLQPVLGIFPAALLHGALHGQFQHAPILILQVAGWSTLMGIVRKYTNTTTTIITHATFNFITTFLFAFNP